MTTSQILTAIYDAIKDGERTALQTFLDLEKNHGMTGIKRTEFEKRWEDCLKYPVKGKLDAIAARQQELMYEINNALLSLDPPWEEVVEVGSLIKAAAESPRGLPDALEMLSEYSPDLAAKFKKQASKEFPEIFPATKPVDALIAAPTEPTSGKAKE